MENMKIGYIGIAEISNVQIELFAEKPGYILSGLIELRNQSPEDMMGDKPLVELIDMKRIRYIEEE